MHLHVPVCATIPPCQPHRALSPRRLTVRGAGSLPWSPARSIFLIHCTVGASGSEALRSLPAPGHLAEAGATGATEGLQNPVLPHLLPPQPDQSLPSAAPRACCNPQLAPCKSTRGGGNTGSPGAAEGPHPQGLRSWGRCATAVPRRGAPAPSCTHSAGRTPGNAQPAPSPAKGEEAAGGLGEGAEPPHPQEGRPGMGTAPPMGGRIGLPLPHGAQG